MGNASKSMGRCHFSDVSGCPVSGDASLKCARRVVGGGCFAFRVLPIIFFSSTFGV